MTLRDRLLPWSGYVFGGLGWAASSQWDSMHVSDACLYADPVETTLVGLLGLIVIGCGAFLSVRASRTVDSPTALFVARVALAADAVFTLALIFQLAATLLIPHCFS